MDEGEEIRRLRKELMGKRWSIVLLILIFVEQVTTFCLNVSGVVHIGIDVYSLDYLSGDDIFFIVYMVLLVLGIVYVAVKYRRLRRKIALLEQRHHEESGRTEDEDG